MNFAKQDFLVNAMFNLGCKKTDYGDELKLHTFIISILEKAGFKVETGYEILDRTDKKDKEYNRRKENVNAIYAVRGDAPNIMLNAHLDQVIRGNGSFIPPIGKPTTHKTIFSSEKGLMQCIKRSDKIYGNLVRARNRRIKKIDEMRSLGIDQEVIRDGDILYTPGGNIGGDDKCGVAIILAIATQTKLPLKVYFSSGEEKIKGAAIGEKDFYEGVDFSFTIDRQGTEDFVEAIGGSVLQSDDFRNICVDVGFNYKKNIKLVDGGYCDACAIVHFVPECFNVSCGYFEPHQSSEHVKIQDMYSTYQWMQHLAIKIHDEKIKPFREVQKQCNGYHMRHRGYFDVGSGGYYSNRGQYGGGYRTTGPYESGRGYHCREDGKMVFDAPLKKGTVVLVHGEFWDPVLSRNINTRISSDDDKIIGVVGKTVAKDRTSIEVVHGRYKGKNLKVKNDSLKLVADRLLPKGVRKKFRGKKVRVESGAENFMSIFLSPVYRIQFIGTILNAFKLADETLFLVEYDKRSAYDSIICVSKSKTTMVEERTFLKDTSTLPDIYIIPADVPDVNSAAPEDFYIKDETYSSSAGMGKYFKLHNREEITFKSPNFIKKLSKEEVEKLYELINFGRAGEQLNSFIARRHPDAKEEKREEFWKLVREKINRRDSLLRLEDSSPADKKELDTITFELITLEDIIHQGGIRD
jgi:hypothetical protein